MLVILRAMPLRCSRVCPGGRLGRRLLAAAAPSSDEQVGAREETQLVRSQAPAEIPRRLSFSRFLARLTLPSLCRVPLIAAARAEVAQCAPRLELYVLDFASKAFQEPKHFAEARHRSLIFALHRRSGARRRFGRRAGPANGCGCARAMPKQELDTDLARLLGRGHTPLSLV